MHLFPDIITYLRKKNNLSQQELAEKLEISRSAIGMYETGKREPDFDTLVKFSKFFGVSVEYLLNGTGGTSEWILNGIIVFKSDCQFEIDKKVKELEDEEHDIVYQAPGIVIFAASDGSVSKDMIDMVVNLYKKDTDSLNAKKILMKVSEEEKDIIHNYRNADEMDKRLVQRILKVDSNAT